MWSPLSGRVRAHWRALRLGGVVDQGGGKVRVKHEARCAAVSAAALRAALIAELGKLRVEDGRCAGRFHSGLDLHRTCQTEINRYRLRQETAMREYADYDGLGLAALVKQGDVTPGELLDAAIARIERHNGKLNAVNYTAFDEARRTTTSALPDGPFKGVPFLIKDLGLRVKGWPRTSASLFASVDADAEDSSLVTRYRDAGVVLAGKTNTPEFGIPGVTTSRRLGPCRNPWNTDHISGGSSGGAASAVASGMVAIAHASDGLGSIRIPAACCGLVGLKTTRDRNPNGVHDTDRAIGFSVDHVVSRTVRDSAAMLDATGYPEPASPFAHPAKARPYLEEVGRSPGKLRIAWSSETPTGNPIDPEVRTALERTAETLAVLGHDVREEGLGIDYRLLYRAQGLVSAASFAAGLHRWIEIKGRDPRDGEIEGLARRLYQRGMDISGEEAMWGWQQLRLMNRQILQRFEAWNAYLTPVLCTPPPRVDYLDTLTDDLREFDRRQAATFGFTPPFNMTGQPSLSLPLWQSESGLPIGIMFTARYADEATLFTLAGQLEKELPWASRKPPVWN